MHVEMIDSKSISILLYVQVARDFIRHRKDWSNMLAVLNVKRIINVRSVGIRK